MVTGEKRREFRPEDSEWFMCRVRDKKTGVIPRSDISHIVFYHGYKPGRARFAVEFRSLSKRDDYDITYSNGLRVQSPPGEYKWEMILGNIIWVKNCARFGLEEDTKPASPSDSENFPPSDQEGEGGDAAAEDSSLEEESEESSPEDESP